MLFLFTFLFYDGLLSEEGCSVKFHSFHSKSRSYEICEMLLTHVMTGFGGFGGILLGRNYEILLWLLVIQQLVSMVRWVDR